jgi:hypothetical protein
VEIVAELGRGAASTVYNAGTPKASRDFVRQHGIDHPPVLYLREDVIADPVDVFLHKELGCSNLAATTRGKVRTGQRPRPSGPG